VLFGYILSPFMHFVNTLLLNNVLNGIYLDNICVCFFTIYVLTEKDKRYYNYIKAINIFAVKSVGFYNKCVKNEFLLKHRDFAVK
jgi:hypothetical protein